MYVCTIGAGSGFSLLSVYERGGGADADNLHTQGVAVVYVGLNTSCSLAHYNMQSSIHDMEHVGAIHIGKQQTC